MTKNIDGFDTIFCGNLSQVNSISNRFSHLKILITTQLNKTLKKLTKIGIVVRTSASAFCRSGSIPGRSNQRLLKIGTDRFLA